MKNVKVRIIETKYSQATYGEYRKYYIEILGPKYLSEPCNYLEAIGTLEWQTDKEHENNEEGKYSYVWYGMSYDIRTDKPENIMAMAKLAKYIQDNSVSGSPSEVLAILGAKEYIYYDMEFIPKDIEGQNRYKVLGSNGRLFKYLYAPNEILAEKIKAKSKDTSDLTLEFDKVITFPL